jgi:hypothetical protein
VRRPHWSRGAGQWITGDEQASMGLPPSVVGPTSFSGFVDPIMVGGLPRSSWSQLRLVAKRMPASVVDISLTRDVWDLLVLAEQAPNRESLPDLPPEACVVWDAIQQDGKTVKEVRPPFILDLLDHFPRMVMDGHQRALDHVLLYGSTRLRYDYRGLRDVLLVRGFMNEPFTFGSGELRVLSAGGGQRALRPGGTRSRRARVVRRR